MYIYMYICIYIYIYVHIRYDWVSSTSSRRPCEALTGRATSKAVQGKRPAPGQPVIFEIKDNRNNEGRKEGRKEGRNEGRKERRKE